MVSEKPVTPIAAGEADQVARMLLVWLAEYPALPVDEFNYNILLVDEPCLALSPIQAAYQTKRYILGGFEAELQFKLIYRLQPTNNNQRLSADEALNAMADWATSRVDKPELGGSRRFRKLTSNTRSDLFGRYEDGTEDHQILMTMTYEVI